ncbi:MAG TPA: hypothetical protein ENN87_04730 [Phycisphaerales bacterium]|nr:hypothetical protein [Phycisphaerales bacterium]
MGRFASHECSEMDKKGHAVLLFSRGHTLDVRPLLKEMGFEVVAKRSTAELVDDLRHGSYRAAILDHDGLDRDVLEVILNIQDFDREMPVVVISNAREMEHKELLVSLGRIYLINANGSLTQLRRGLQAALEPFHGGGGEQSQAQ